MFPFSHKKALRINSDSKSSLKLKSLFVLNVCENGLQLKWFQPIRFLLFLCFLVIIKSQIETKFKK